MVGASSFGDGGFNQESGAFICREFSSADNIESALEIKFVSKIQRTKVMIKWFVFACDVVPAFGRTIV